MVETQLQDHIGFLIDLSKIRQGVFLPKYYDPEIETQFHRLKRTHNLLRFGDLLGNKHVLAATGDEIGKMAYGTGVIPFVRTSDVSNWELKTDAKQGVSDEVYKEYGQSQDVQAEDILFVRDGTYLIGQVALVAATDLPMLYQSHLVKFRVVRDSPISKWMLLASLSTPIVKRQIKAKQFTADIIDTIGDRFRELILPIPKDRALVTRIEREVIDLVAERSRLRDKIRRIPYWVEGHIDSSDEQVPDEAVTDVIEHGNTGFLREFSSIRNRVFIPKYYDPKLEMGITELSNSHELIPLQRLVDDKIISWETGIEVGKMAYGTGRIPFVRTSDITNWELKGDPKQNVSDEIYEANKQDIKADDIFVVRDGTYLVGTSCILTEKDTRILYCGGLYKLRVDTPSALDPCLLLAILNTPIVRRQMRAKQFTRDIIDTLGKRLFEVVLPIPKEVKLRQRIAAEVRSVIETRARLRDRTKEIALQVEGLDVAAADLEVLDVE